MDDRFSDYATGLTAPARDAAAILPDDGADLPEASRAIYIGGTGSLRVRMVSGATADFAAVQGGLVYPFRVARVMATGTTATGLVALR
jgi:hypothetical protein